jgi:hypothetical protein
MRLNFIRLFATLAALMAALPARAQGTVGPGAVEIFTLSATALGGYDSDLVTPGIRREVDSAASHAATRLMLNFARPSEDFSVYTAAVSEYTYYNANVPIKAPLFSGVAGIAKSLGRRAGLDASVSGNYFPRFQMSLLPVATEAPVDQLASPDFGLVADDILSYSANANLSYQLSQRTSIGGGYGFSRFMSRDYDYELESQAFRGRLTRTLTRYARLQLGYGEQEATYTVDRQARHRRRNRVIDAGIQYSRPLSLSRRTQFSFGTGSTAIDNGTDTRYSLTGHARLSHQLARYWTLSGAYARGLGYIGGFQEPLFSDSIAVSLNGAFGGSVLLSTSAAYAKGVVGYASGNDYESFRAMSRVDVPLSRRFSLYGTYFYYEYQLDDSIVLPNGTAAELGRHGVRAGLVWIIATRR